MVEYRRWFTWIWLCQVRTFKEFRRPYPKRYNFTSHNSKEYGFISVLKPTRPDDSFGVRGNVSVEKQTRKLKTVHVIKFCLDSAVKDSEETGM
jgi:hypothetical protein